MLCPQWIAPRMMWAKRVFYKKFKWSPKLIMTSILKNVVKKFSSLIVLVLEQIRHKEAFTQSMPLQLIHEKKKKKRKRWTDCIAYAWHVCLLSFTSFLMWISHCSSSSTQQDFPTSIKQNDHNSIHINQNRVLTCLWPISIPWWAMLISCYFNVTLSNTSTQLLKNAQ